MSGHRPVPVTVIGGADAASLARRLRRPDDCIIGSVWDGPGSIRVRPDVAHRTPGCPCCALRLDLVDGLLRASRRARRPGRILLVVDPCDDVTTITYTVLSDADLARHVRLDGVVMAIDAVATATRASGCGPLASGLEMDALAVADRIVVGRAGDLTDEGFARVVASLRTVNLVGVILAPLGSGRREDDIAVTGLDAWHGAPVSAEPVSSQHTGDAPGTVVLRQVGPLDPDAVDDWLERLVDTHARRLVRMQGALIVIGRPERVCCHGVRSFAMSHSEDADPASTRRDESLVVLVGRGLDVVELTDGFAATRAR